MPDHELVYSGWFRDLYRKRVNQGYAHIHQKDSYLDGQRSGPVIPDRQLMLESPMRGLTSASFDRYIDTQGT